MRTTLAVLALGALVAGTGCRDKGTAPPVTARATMADSAEQVMVNVRTILTDKGVARGELFADTAYIFDDNTRFELRKVRATFNTSTGVKDGVMSADRGRYSIRQQTLEGFGNVIIVTNDGKRLTAPQLKYIQGLNEVSSDSAFTLIKPGQTLSGVGFKADPQLTRVSIFRGAKGSGSFTLPGQ